MVRVWGKWCGPNWTAGQRIPAKKYDWENDPNPSVKDDLDNACRLHDRVYGTGGNKKRADKDLERSAKSIASTSTDKKKKRAASEIYQAMVLKRWFS